MAKPIEIEIPDNDDICIECPFSVCDGCGHDYCVIEAYTESFKPGPDCPKPGKYRLVKVEDDDAKAD